MISSQHADPAITVRPPADVLDAAREVLAARDRRMRDFITACMTRLAADPDRMLDELAPHWPPPKPKGRPRRSEDPGSG